LKYFGIDDENSNKNEEKKEEVKKEELSLMKIISGD